MEATLPTDMTADLPVLLHRARAACMRSDDGDNLPRWGRRLVRDLADEVERLHKWADGFADAQLKERALAEARIQEMQVARQSGIDSALRVERERRWPQGREAGRVGDMAPPDQTHMRVGFDADNDVYVAVWGDGQLAAIEFCCPGIGGGKSGRTRDALIALMVAMEADNAESPRHAYPPAALHPSETP